MPDDTISLSRHALVSLVNQLLGGNPNQDDAALPNPWDAVIRRSLERMMEQKPNMAGPALPAHAWLAGLLDEPWVRAGLNPQPLPPRMGVGDVLLQAPWVRVGLNPQPLPPRVAFALTLAEEVASRVRALHEVADVFPDEAQSRMRDNAGTMLSRFVDDCSNGRLTYGQWSSAVGLQPDHASATTSAVDLIVMAVQFDTAATTTANERLHQDFADASAKLLESGLSKL